MSYFNTLRNGQSLACLLPPEILNSIFSLTSNVFSDFSSRPLEAARREESFDWHPMCLSGVCRYWKAVALSFPSIWSTIDICDEDECPSSSSIDIAKLCLRRSYNGCVDVHISCPIPKAELPWITETLASQSIRFRGFHIYGFSFGPEILQHFAEDPAPELQSLTISPQGDFSNGSGIVLPMLFAGYTPRLRHLVLKHITSWPGNDFSNLRSLRLEDQVASCPISKFLDFLHHSPHLEDLILVCAGPSEADPAVQLRQLSLPRLRQLVLKECPAICQATRILPYIQPSPTVTIMIDRTYYNNSLTTGSNIARCNTLLATMSRFASMPNITRLLLDTFSSFDRGSHKLRLTGTGLSSFDICPSADIHEMASNQYMAAAIGLISACNIQELWIGSDHVIQKDYIWQRLLFAMPSLKKIVLGPWDSHTPGCLLALHTPDESVGRALPCPSLEELVILGRLGESKWSCEAVQKLLVNRKARGFPVRRVVLVRRTHDTSFDLHPTADRFREIVEKMEIQTVPRYPTMEGSEAARALGRYF
ncbi:hypothetical protein PHLCEN_2v791 [Hermanssonia centrifuga]|uniref:Uncharacterized protein n=1 Tax=Hermanssonia centrifuga TaxID=98765 RepID=A0A2R6S4U1_9APHY|nr:hypothetical protein PHLCEN_2v791 [Hermanssonia centrifuga]